MNGKPIILGWKPFQNEMADRLNHISHFSPNPSLEVWKDEWADWICLLAPPRDLWGRERRTIWKNTAKLAW